MRNSDIKRFFLVGFMGSGKTYWGKRWANKLGIPFFDLDDEIEKHFGMPVKEVFDKYGEDAFRREEANQLKSFYQKSQFLLSCGGGTPCFFNNMEEMQRVGTVVYLKASAEYLLSRMSNEIEQRPLLAKLPAEERLAYITGKLNEREPVYRLAGVVVDVANAHDNSLSRI